MELNYNGFEYIQRANTARQVSEISLKQEKAMRAAEREKQERIKRDERKVAGAEANIAQNEILLENNTMLKEMFDAQVEANREAKEESKKSKRYNAAMMIIAILTLVVAIAGLIVTIVASR